MHSTKPKRARFSSNALQQLIDLMFQQVFIKSVLEQKISVQSYQPSGERHDRELLADLTENEP